jgi:hypothetical protein
MIEYFLINTRLYMTSRHYFLKRVNSLSRVLLFVRVQVKVNQLSFPSLVRFLSFLFLKSPISSHANGRDGTGTGDRSPACACGVPPKRKDQSPRSYDLGAQNAGVTSFWGTRRKLWQSTRNLWKLLLYYIAYLKHIWSIFKAFLDYNKSIFYF